MLFNFEAELSAILSKPFEGKQRAKDPYKSKKLDHKNRSVKRFDKHSKSNRRFFYRSFRSKDKYFCKKILMIQDFEMENLVEPVIKKTSGVLIL